MASKLDFSGLDNFAELTKAKPPADSALAGNANGKPLEVPLASVHPDPNQPRQAFDETALQELAASIAERGLIQPVVVRETLPDQYMIVSGERRWRAHQLLGKPTIAVLLSETGEFVDQLIENIQRADLSTVELIKAVRRLLEEEGLSQAAIAKKTGMSKAWVSKYASLTALPSALHALLESGVCGDSDALVLLSRLLKQYPEATESFIAERSAAGEAITLPDVKQMQARTAHALRELDISSALTPGLTVVEAAPVSAANGSAGVDKGSSTGALAGETERTAVEGDSDSAAANASPASETNPNQAASIVKPTKKKKRIIQVKVGRREAALLPDEVSDYGLVWVQYEDASRELLDANRVKLVATVEV